MGHTIPTFNHKTLMGVAMVMAFIQFTNALEYMALTPIFAFMATAFAVPISYSGYVSGMYTFGAVLSGIAAFYWIDRFKKKPFLFMNMLLLGALTCLATLTTRFDVLLGLRFAAGLVGGTTMGVGISMLINCAPPQMRGKVLATVIASFSLVSIVGMPGVLFLCTHYGWHPALWSIATLCLLSLPLIVGVLPHEETQTHTKVSLSLNMHTLLFASIPALVQFSPMLIIPILTPLMLQFMGVPENLLPLLYLAGGIAGYLSTKITGGLTTRVSPLMLSTVSTLCFMASLLLPERGHHYAALFMILFLGASYSRLVTASAVALQYPTDSQRARFSSLQTAIMAFVTTLAFFLSSLLLPAQEITPQNLHRLLIVSAFTAAGFPIMIILLQKILAKGRLTSDC